jgi:hypothetical protein
LAKILLGAPLGTALADCVIATGQKLASACPTMGNLGGARTDRNQTAEGRTIRTRIEADLAPRMEFAKAWRLSIAPFKRRANSSVRLRPAACSAAPNRSKVIASLC